MIALSILTVVLIMLGGLMFQVGVQTRRSAALSYRSAALQQADAWIESIPWDSLDTVLGLGCTTDTTGQLVYARCATVTDTLGLKRVTVVISPEGNLITVPDTLVKDRARPRSALPFK